MRRNDSPALEQGGAKTANFSHDMRALSLLIFTLLAGPALAQEAEAPPLGCKEDHADCKEGCTIEYGGSTRTYSQLGTCLQKCKQTYDKCTARHLALQKQKKEGAEPHSGPETPPEPKESKGSAVSTPAPKSENGESSEPSVRTGVYRASESKKVAEPEPEAKPAPKAAEKAVHQEDPADELAKAMDPEPAQKPEPAKKGGGKTAAKAEPAAKSEPTTRSEPKPESEKPAAVDPTETTAKPMIDQDVPLPAPSKPEPAAKPEPKPEPKAQPKPAPAPAKRPPPKRDIDDWDPNEK